MGWQGLWIGIGGITVADMPDKPGLRRRLTARLFGGASGGVFRGMATLALGSGIGRVIGIVSIPVLTRLYSPEDFGVLAVFTALVAILAPLVTLRYVLALPLPQQDGVAMNLLVLSSGLMLVLTLLVTLVLWTVGPPLLARMSMEVLAPWWWLIAVGVLGTALYEMLTMWATRRRDYKAIAQTSVTQSAAGAMVKITLGLAAFAPLGLLLGQVVAQAGGIGRLLRGFMTEFCANWQHVSSSRMRKVAWRHRGFPVWRVPSQFLLSFSQKAAIGFFALNYGPAITGQLSIALVGVTITSNLIGQSLSKSFYGELSVISGKNEIKLVMSRIVLFVILLASPTAFLLAAFGPSITKLLLGNSWILAGEFLRYLSVYLVFSLVAVSLSSVLNKLGGQYPYFLLNLLRAISVFFIFVISAGLKLSPVETVIFFSAGMAVIQSITIAYFFIAVGKIKS